MKRLHKEVILKPIKRKQCDMCYRALGTSLALKAHKHTMHEISKCEICGQTLYKTFWLERHTSSSHKSLRKTDFITKITQAVSLI